VRIYPARPFSPSNTFKQDEVCRWVGFVDSGCLRYYMLDHQAESDHLFSAVEDWWVGRPGQLQRGTRSLYNLQALEAVNCLLFEREPSRSFAALPAGKGSTRSRPSQAYSAITDRYIQFQALSAEEKYLQLARNPRHCSNACPSITSPPIWASSRNR